MIMCTYLRELHQETDVDILTVLSELADLTVLAELALLELLDTFRTVLEPDRLTVWLRG